LEKNAVRSLEEKVQSEVLEPAGLGNVSMGEVAMGSGGEFGVDQVEMLEMYRDEIR
jgi:hypothetical protein